MPPTIDVLGSATCTTNPDMANIFIKFKNAGLDRNKTTTDVLKTIDSLRNFLKSLSPSEIDSTGYTATSNGPIASWRLITPQNWVSTHVVSKTLSEVRYGIVASFIIEVRDFGCLDKIATAIFNTPYINNLTLRKSATEDAYRIAVGVFFTLGFSGATVVKATEKNVVIEPEHDLSSQTEVFSSVSSRWASSWTPDREDFSTNCDNAEALKPVFVPTGFKLAVHIEATFAAGEWVLDDTQQRYLTD